MAHPPNKQIQTAQQAQQAQQPGERPLVNSHEPGYSSEEQGMRPPLIQPDLEAHAFIPPRIEPEPEAEVDAQVEAQGEASDADVPIGDRKDIR
ncbi:MAG: hypothetical protein EOP24_30290 [Hyphomicrobiales bacterium]|nr:MAG: hypothetical protein EOP24_30290 [Hyphomicrobiales bacterium]